MSMSSVRDVKTQYAGPSALVAQEGRAQVNLALDASRGQVGVRGTVKSPALFRDALMAAFDVLGSDLRYKRKDLAVYLAYLTKQGKKANKEIWEAQKAFLEQQLGNEEKPQQVLEPVLTVSPDEISLEVFSRDESSYARLPAFFPVREARSRARHHHAVRRRSVHRPLRAHAQLAARLSRGHQPAGHHAGVHAPGAARLAAQLRAGAVGLHAARGRR